MSPKRLLVAIDEMEIGGSQRQIVHLLTGIDRSRWEPELVYFRQRSFLVDALENAGIHTHYLPKHGRLDFGFLRRYARLLEQGRYDLIHAFSLTAELWTALARMSLRARPPLVASVRNLYADQPAWHWWLKRFVLGRSAAVIANSRSGAEATAQLTGTPPEFFDVIGNGVRIPESISVMEREAMRAAVGVATGRVFALFVGRLVPQKNITCLVDAMALLPADQRPWIALAGEGPLRQQMQAKAAAAGVASDLCFLGERPDAQRLMQAADFLVLPSHYEGLSNALLEAMAAGCPVIASAVPGNTDLIENERTGLLFAADDRAALSQSLARLTHDDRLRMRLSEQAREHARNRHAVPALVSATLAVYERCLAKTSRHAITAASPRPSDAHHRGNRA